MKKAIGIIILGFILAGCASSDRIYSGGAGNIIKKDSYKIELGYTIEQGGFEYSHISEAGLEISRKIASEHCATHNKFAFEQREHYLTHRGETLVYLCDAKNLDEGWWNNYDESSKIYASAEKIELETMIDKAKDTCKSLGFKEGTEKFSDCGLKLYTQSVELAAEQNKTVVMQPQSSGSNTMTIYDPVRDNRALMRQGQRMLSGACTLGINC